MVERQMSLAERFMDPRMGVNATLDAIDGMIDWRPLEAILKPVRPGDTGRPPFAPLAMMKALYLAAMYDLSDPGLEAELNDRLSFRRFCGIGLEMRAPDETTLCRFRKDAGDAARTCFEEINRQLEKRGLFLKKGTLMDATLIKAHRCPPRVEDVGLGQGDAAEPQASWTRKNGKSFYGYKAHIGADEGSLLVRRIEVTGAKTYESEVADDLISWDEKAVYGDKAYPLKARRAALKAAGIKDRIAKRRHKSEPPLSPRQALHNDLIARRRAPIEGLFSRLKNKFGRARARSSRFMCNVFDIVAVFTVHNMERAVRLEAA